MFSIYRGNITQLKDNEVFVFTSNLDGFSGFGSAGYATFNENGNVWRKYNYDKWPYGKKGKWNYKGQSRGLGYGEIGKSYAIPTVTRCGAKKSIPLEDIKVDIIEFRKFAIANPKLTFYVAQKNEIGLSGWPPSELASIWRGDWPANVFFEEGFAKLL